jgi:hypothetical protein
MTVTIYIPTVCVGALIGRKGQTIGQMQKQAQQLAGSQSDQVKISIVHHPGNAAEHGTSPPSAPAAAPNTPTAGTPFGAAMTTYTELDFSDPAWTPVVIHAHSMACLYICAAILDICIEWVTDRTQIQYIFDLPISSGSIGGGSGSPSVSSVINNAHATIIGKRGQTLMALSANTGCRIMVPPKQLHHNVVQLEGPLQECTSCLEAIAHLLNARDVDALSGQTSPKDAGKSIAKNAQIRSQDNRFQVSFLVMPLPSQTKLRNIARRTETVIRKKRLTKAALEGIANTISAVAAKKQRAVGKATTEGVTDVENVAAVEAASSADSAHAAAAAATTTTSNAVPWQLTILGSNANQVIAARKKLKPFLIKNVEEETNIELRDAMSVADKRSQRHGRGNGGGDMDNEDEDESSDTDSDDEENGSGVDAIIGKAATTPKGTRTHRADSTVSSSAGENTDSAAATDSSERGPSPPAASAPKFGGRGRRNRSNSHGKK